MGSAGKKVSVQIVEPSNPGGNSRGYNIVKPEERHGTLHKAIPCMPLPLAVVCCIFNIVIPGFGTLVSSFSVFCCGTTRIEQPLKAFGLNLACAILQMLTFVVIFGWIWSILWGMTFVQLALSSKEAAMPSPVPYYVRRQSSVD